jgi:hypothetical protein
VKSQVLVDINLDRLQAFVSGIIFDFSDDGSSVSKSKYYVN